MPEDNTPWPEDLLKKIGTGLCKHCNRPLDDHAGLLTGEPKCPVAA